MPTHLNALPDGYKLHEYELVRVLGVGGFGITYLGYDHHLDKPVAIKEYLPNDLAIRKDNTEVLAKSDTNQSDFDWGLERFLEEARVLARFDHRNLVKVYRFFEAHGTAYIVMEYVEGETLSQRLERGSLSEAEWLQMLNPLALGLIKVHKSNFLHRDIKPANMLIRTEDDSPVLVDFGAARMAIGAHSRSITAVITPGYAPMEQYSSKGKQGPWTDIYALGAMSYKALTGTTPPDATDRVMDDELQPISQLNPNLSPALVTAIEWSLRIRSDERPQSVEAWQASWQGVKPITPIPTTPKDVKDNESTTRRTSGLMRAVLLVLIPASTPIPTTPKDVKDNESTTRRTSGLMRAVLLVLIPASVVLAALWWPFGVNTPDIQLKELSKASVEGGSKSQALQTLTQAGIDPDDLNKVDKNGSTALMGAAANGHTEIARALIQAEVDLHKTSIHGDTALILAAINGHTEIAQALIQAGADLNKTNKYGHTALILAAHNGHTEIAQALIQAGADLNKAINDGHTALIWAALKGHTEIVQRLIQAGTDLNKAGKNGFTALSLAAHNGHTETVQALIQAGADLNKAINNGSTALSLAAHKGHTEIVQALIQTGADLNKANKAGNTALSSAAFKGHTEIARLLRAAGARQ